MIIDNFPKKVTYLIRHIFTSLNLAKYFEGSKKKQKDQKSKISEIENQALKKHRGRLSKIRKRKYFNFIESWDNTMSAFKFFSRLCLGKNNFNHEIPCMISDTFLQQKTIE